MPYGPQTERWRALIRKHTPADLRGDAGFERIALAVLTAESGGNPGAVGDNGASVGLFQLHERGMGSGLTRGQRSDPDTNAGRAVPALASAYRANRGDPVRTYIQAINPGATPDGPQVAGVMAAYGQGGGPKVQNSVQAQTGGAPVADPRTDKMREQHTVLGREAEAIRKDIAALRVAGADETPAGPLADDIARAQGARANRVQELTARQTDLRAVESEIRRLEVDLANDPAPKAAPSEPATYRPVTDPNTGQVVKLQDPVTGQIIDLPDPSKPKVPGMPDITIIGGRPYTVERVTSQDAHGGMRSQVVLTPVPGAEGTDKDPARVTSGRRIIERQPDGTWQSVYEAPLTDDRRPDQVAKDELDLEKARQDLLPKQQRIFRDLQESIKVIQGMLERGEIEQDEAEGYVSAFKAAAQAELRGSTPFDEMKEKRQAADAKRSAGTSLANSLLSSATTMAQSSIFRPGQTSLNYDPLESLMPILNQLGGETGGQPDPMAAGLVQGAGGPPPVGTVIATVPDGASPVGVSGMRGGLPPGPLPAGL